MNLLNRPYDLLESSTFKYAYIFGGASFALLFLWIFEPFGLYNLAPQEKITTLGLYVGCGTLSIAFQFFVLQRRVIKRYTVGITILWIAFSFFILGASVFMVNAIFFKESSFLFSSFLYYQKVILSINIIPTIFIILVHHNYLLKKRLSVAKQLNKQFHDTSTDKVVEHKIISLESENKKETLELSLNSLLFIQSANNYVNIYYLDGPKVVRKLLRNNLTKIVRHHKEVPEIFRCHKSYIINKRKIESVIGNAAGYKIKLEAYPELIPVSRNLNKTIPDLKNS